MRLGFEIMSDRQPALAVDSVVLVPLLGTILEGRARVLVDSIVLPVGISILLVAAVQVVTR